LSIDLYRCVDYTVQVVKVNRPLHCVSDCSYILR